MKNLIFRFILFLSLTSLSAQELNVYVEYIDKQIYRKETTAHLISNDKNAVYTENQSKDNGGNEAMANPGGGSAVAAILEVKPNKFYKQKDSNIIYYNEYLKDIDTIYYVYDSMPKLNWELISGTDTISGFACKKAKVKFRGSNLTAYYTPDIPISSGPWKFNGLPGLILKVSSDDYKEIYWQATKVVYPYKKKTDYTFDKYKYTISLKEFKFSSFRIYQDKIPDKTLMNAAQRLKYGRRIFVVEKVYEWEKEGDVWRPYFMDYFQKIPPW
ncbi:GLPGLI family protein [Moheibacter sediminis]|uniref:GLPGLI family protein n=1 Tax=Moheibacter sediminis TaxID=1434700 RepID=A0A1W1ZMF6_9FLAO|nr:GLPGLI family protein [Moheibacter sediminis]SMC49288.1 GLPGLI family protein [Moheibacter sediminis]